MAPRPPLSSFPTVNRLKKPVAAYGSAGDTDGAAVSAPAFAMGIGSGSANSSANSNQTGMAVAGGTPVPGMTPATGGAAMPSQPSEQQKQGIADNVFAGLAKQRDDYDAKMGIKQYASTDPIHSRADLTTGPLNASTNAAAGAGDNDVLGFMKSQYDDILKQDDADWQAQQGALQGQMAGYQARADSLNARMGGSVAGGYAGLAGAGLTAGMNAYNTAAFAHNDRRRQLQLAYLDQQIQERQRQEAHGWAQNDPLSTSALQQQTLENGGTLSGYNPREQHYLDQINGFMVNLPAYAQQEIQQNLDTFKVNHSEDVLNRMQQILAQYGYDLTPYDDPTAK